MFEDFRQAFEDPASWHAMVVHFPIVLGSLACLPILAALVFRLRHKALLWVGLAMLVLMSISVFVAIQAGEAADDGLKISDLMPREEGAIKRHEELAEKGWIWPLIPAALLVVALVPMNRPWGKVVRTTAASLAVVGALGVGTWVGITAHAGGQIVYVYGVGPPDRGTKLPHSEMKNQLMPSPFEDEVRAE